MAEKIINLSVIDTEDIELELDEITKGDKGDTYVPNINRDVNSTDYGLLKWDIKRSYELNEIKPINIIGPDGKVWKPVIDGDGNLSWILQAIPEEPTVTNIRGPQGFTFIPAVSADGILTWTNNGGLTNPGAVDITGPQGEQGIQGIQGPKGDPFTIAKTFTSVDEMNTGFATDNVPQGGFVVIDTGNVEDEENARLYIKGEAGYFYITDLSGAQGIKGDPFKYEDFTAEQLESLRGPQGEAFTYEDFTAEQLAGLVGPQGPQGEPFTYEDFTSAQLESLVGPQGDQGEVGPQGEPGEPGISATHSWDGTTLTITSASGTSSADLRGPQGERGADGTVTFTDLTDEQKSSLKGDKGDPGEQGEKGDPLTYDDMTEAQKMDLVDSVVGAMGDEYATKDYVAENGGKIDNITVNGGDPLEIVDKTVNIPLVSAQIHHWEDGERVETDNTGAKVIYSTSPRLTDEQKNQIQKLMDDYRDASKWVYDGTFRRESYAYPNVISSLNNAGIEGCIYDGKYIINCGLLCQMLWMGRAFSDFDVNSPTTSITKAFDWGYYFDFIGAKTAFGVMKNDTEYYSANTYTTENDTTIFTTFDNAASMAQELYKKGCEIPYSEVEVGDLIFYRSKSITDGDNDALEQTSFRYITHVGIVYDVNEYGPIVLESSSAWASAIGRIGYGESYLTRFSVVRAADQEVRACMVARHPAAYGVACNVPDKFEVYRGTLAI